MALSASHEDTIMLWHPTHLQGEILNEDETLNILLNTPPPEPNLPQNLHTNDILIIPEQQILPTQQHSDNPSPKSLDFPTEKQQKQQRLAPETQQHCAPELLVYSRRRYSPKADIAVPNSSTIEDCSTTAVTLDSPSFDLPIAI
ncbi:hypothetical protein HRI_001490500 [Hibiscus trionum]|uniref:Uncharacterized protein n=1 Tax=Hibiscus trionum TaxID=183268 RepID=A0A9W7LUM4_HIBTR|nr:hypothetical protein HRI_001490500 [Hibiscus trionum]